MNHSFNVEIATIYGVEKAVLLENFYFWIKKNEANKKNIHDGKAYTFNTAAAFAELFPYIKERQIAKILREMENTDGLLLSGQFNSYVRTKSYTLTDKALELLGEKTKKHTSHSTKKGDSIVTKSDNGTSQKVTIEPTKKGDCLNTDINTDIKQTDINTMAKKPKEQYDTIYNHYLDNYKSLYEQGKLETDKVKINYGKNGKLIQDLLKIFSVDDILKVLDRGMDDWFCLNNGYTLSPILSDSVFSRLLNARPVKEKPQRSDWSGQATDEEYRAGASNLDTIGF